MTTRRVTVHVAAIEDFEAMKEQNPGLLKQAMVALKILAAEDDIFSPRKSLSVCLAYPVAPDMLRFKAHGQSWRIILQLMDRDDEPVKPIPGMDTRDLYLQVVMLATRGKETYRIRLKARRVEIAGGK